MSEVLYRNGVSIGKTNGTVRVEAPGKAQDATLVPVTIQIAQEARLMDVTLVIDQNPAPLAAKVVFGPAGDPRHMKFRVRVDGFTNIHAVTATENGRLLQDAVFVKLRVAARRRWDCRSPRLPPVWAR